MAKTTAKMYFIRVHVMKLCKVKCQKTIKIILAVVAATKRNLKIQIPFRL